MVGQFGRTSW